MTGEQMSSLITPAGGAGVAPVGVRHGEKAPPGAPLLRCLENNAHKPGVLHGTVDCGGCVADWARAAEEARLHAGRAAKPPLVTDAGDSIEGEGGRGSASEEEVVCEAGEALRGMLRDLEAMKVSARVTFIDAGAAKAKAALDLVEVDLPAGDALGGSAPPKRVTSLLARDSPRRAPPELDQMIRAARGEALDLRGIARLAEELGVREGAEQHRLMGPDPALATAADRRAAAEALAAAALPPGGPAPAPGKTRRVVDFSMTINPLAHPFSLAYTGVGDLAGGAHAGNGFAVFDAKKGFVAMPVAADQRRYLCWQSPSTHKVYMALRAQFGGSETPGYYCTFTAMLKEGARRAPGAADPARAVCPGDTGLEPALPAEVDGRLEPPRPGEPALAALGRLVTACPPEVVWAHREGRWRIAGIVDDVAARAPYVMMTATLLFLTRGFSFVNVTTNDKTRWGTSGGFLGAWVALGAGPGGSSTTTALGRSLLNTWADMARAVHVAQLGGGVFALRWWEGLIGRLGWLASFDTRLNLLLAGVRQPFYRAQALGLGFVRVGRLSTGGEPAGDRPLATILSRALQGLGGVSAYWAPGDTPGIVLRCSLHPEGGQAALTPAGGRQRGLASLSDATVFRGGFAGGGILPPRTPGGRPVAVYGRSERPGYDSSSAELMMLLHVARARFRDSRGAAYLSTLDHLGNVYRGNKARAAFGSVSWRILDEVWALADEHAVEIAIHWVPRTANALADGLAGVGSVAVARAWAAARGRDLVLGTDAL